MTGLRWVVGEEGPLWVSAPKILTSPLRAAHPRWGPKWVQKGATELGLGRGPRAPTLVFFFFFFFLGQLSPHSRWGNPPPRHPITPEPSHLGSESTSTSLLGPCAGPHIIRGVKVQRGYPPAVRHPRVGLQEVRHWQKYRDSAHLSLGLGTPSSYPWGHLSLAWRACVHACGE